MDVERITLWFEPDLHKLLQVESKRKGIPITDLINIILFDYFENVVPE